MAGRTSTKTTWIPADIAKAKSGLDTLNEGKRNMIRCILKGRGTPESVAKQFSISVEDVITVRDTPEPSAPAKRAATPPLPLRPAAKAEPASSRRLTEAQATEIRRMAAEGRPRLEIAEHFGVSRSAVDSILSNYSHHDPKFDPRSVLPNAKASKAGHMAAASVSALGAAEPTAASKPQATFMYLGDSKMVRVATATPSAADAPAPVHPPQPVTPDPDEVLELTYQQIADEIGSHNASVRGLVRRSNGAWPCTHAPGQASVVRIPRRDLDELKAKRKTEVVNRAPDTASEIVKLTYRQLAEAIGSHAEAVRSLVQRRGTAWGRSSDGQRALIHVPVEELEQMKEKAAAKAAPQTTPAAPEFAVPTPAPAEDLPAPGALPALSGGAAGVPLLVSIPAGVFASFAATVAERSVREGRCIEISQAVLDLITQAATA